MLLRQYQSDTSTYGEQAFDSRGGPLCIVQRRGAQYGRRACHHYRESPFADARYDESQPRTYFGQALIDGLSGKDIVTQSAYVGLFELYEALYRRVKAETNKFDPIQEPMLTLLQGVGPFALAQRLGGQSGSLSPSSIQQTPPKDTALKVVEKTVVKAVGEQAQAWNINAKGNVEIDQRKSVIDMGKGNTFGNVSYGDVAGGNMIKITTAAAAQSDNKEDLLEMISDLRKQIATLADAPKGKREDADDELRKAKEAGAEGNKQRMVEKLESAHNILLALAGTVPAAVKLGEAVGAVLQRAVGLWS